ncbi:MAG: TadE family protein [Candidatus Firestonebacteria bacterium]
MKGQVLVESVLVFPVLIFFLLCIIQIGILFNTYYIVNYASFCAARSAIVHTQLPDQPISCAQSAARAVLLSLKTKEALFLPIVTMKFYGLELEVTVTYLLKPIIPILGGILPYIPVTSSTRLPIEK